MRKKFSFTLAETLITLTIIGVIAAMTVPTLSTKIQKHMWETKVKRAYSVLSNRTKIVLAEKGCEDISCAYSRPISTTYNNDKNQWDINWNQGKDIVDKFITDLFPDAEKVPTSVFSTKLYTLSGEKCRHYSSYAYKLPKENMLISFNSLDFTNYWILMPNAHMNPELRTLKQVTLCELITEFPAKKYIRGRNVFTIALVEDGRWIPSDSYKLFPYRCDPNVKETQTESCLSRLQQNSWKMDY